MVRAVVLAATADAAAAPIKARRDGRWGSWCLPPCQGRGSVAIVSWDRRNAADSLVVAETASSG